MSWTILDPYGTPYGGVEDNIAEPIRHGGSGYEDEETFEPFSYGHVLDLLGEFGNQNTGGVA
ncbi:hypothetical protein [Spirillospora sp. NPDC047279]|uniref:hypothetical protein n=1 Tax=Spirillospora sp. NPDC047279 TaxID=3155478 RepID=UPI0033E5EB82